jgi:hypothetical protein
VTGNTGVFDTDEGSTVYGLGNRVLRVPSCVFGGYGLTAVLSSKRG